MEFGICDYCRNSPDCLFNPNFGCPALDRTLGKDYILTESEDYDLGLLRYKKKSPIMDFGICDYCRDSSICPLTPDCCQTLKRLLGEDYVSAVPLFVEPLEHDADELPF